MTPLDPVATYFWVQQLAITQTHIEDCKRLLGKGYAHVHEWLDEYANKYPPQIYSEYHRQFRHTMEALAEQFKKWGYYEILAAKIHIIRDVDVFVLQKPMEQVEIEEIEELYEEAISNYCHW